MKHPVVGDPSPVDLKMSLSFMNAPRGQFKQNLQSLAQYALLLFEHSKPKVSLNKVKSLITYVF